MRSFGEVGLGHALSSADGEVGDLSTALLSGPQTDWDEIAAGTSACANIALLTLVHPKSGVRESMSGESAIWRSGITKGLGVLLSKRKNILFCK